MRAPEIRRPSPHGRANCHDGADGTAALVEGVAGNAVRPGCMTAGERLSEIAEILARGLTRLQARQSSTLPADFGESSLHIPPDRSGHP
jgi:hypothetical protein